MRQTLEERRRSYKCGERYVTLDQLLTWKQAAAVSPAKAIMGASKYQADARLNEKICVFEGDITTLEVDAVVNSGNSMLSGGGGGVDGAIHAAAGRHLLQECRSLNGCQEGDAKLTGGYKMPAKYVIHTHGPVFQDQVMLASCYRRCLEIAADHGLTSVAFPCICTRMNGFPNESAAQVALSTVRRFLDKDDKRSKKLQRIIFCLVHSIDVDVYSKLLPFYFPTQ